MRTLRLVVLVTLAEVTAWCVMRYVLVPATIALARIVGTL